MTERARVEAEIAAPAAAVWDIFRWDNLDAAVASGLFADIVYEERRPIPGATRIIHLTTGGTVRERLEAYDGDGLGYRYTVLNLDEFPLAEYLGGVSVTPLGEDRSRLVFACEFVPRGITADEWRSLYTAMQQEFMAFARDRLELNDQEK